VVTHLSVDRENHVYAVLAAGRSGGRIVKYSPTGTTLDEWGSRVGARPGSFSAQGPGGIATISTSTVWVTDPGNRRIQKFASDGGVVATCRLDRADPFRSPSDITTDGTATFWVADGSRMVVLSQVSSSSGDICRGAPIRFYGLRAAPSRFSPADSATSNRGGATLRFDLSRRGSIGMSVYRLATGHRPRFVGRATAQGQAGPNAVRFPGWLGNTRLASGRYEIKLVARAANTVGRGSLRVSVR
jgi:hypothetical protein